MPPEAVPLGTRWRVVWALWGFYWCAISLLAVAREIGHSFRSPWVAIAIVLVTIGWCVAAWTRRAEETPRLVQKLLASRRALPVHSLVGFALAGEIAFLLGDGFGYVTPRLSAPYEESLMAGREPFTYHGAPWNRREFDVPVEWNSFGFADREYEIEKARGTRRIVVLGDSFVEALQVPLAQRFHKILEARLDATGRTEVIALGRGGWGQVGELAALEDLGLLLDPDLFVVCFLALNDVTDNLDRKDDPVFDAFSEMYRQPLYDAMARAELQFLPFLYKKVFDLFRAGDQEARYREFSPFAIEYPELIDEGWRRTFRAFEQIEAGCRAAGADLLVFSITQGTESSPTAEPDPGKPDRILRAFCEGRGIDFLSMRDELLGDPSRFPGPLRWEHDHHWNRAGHQAAAAILEEGLAARFPRAH